MGRSGTQGIRIRIDEQAHERKRRFFCSCACFMMVIWLLRLDQRNFEIELYIPTT